MRSWLSASAAGPPTAGAAVSATPRGAGRAPPKPKLGDRHGAGAEPPVAARRRALVRRAIDSIIGTSAQVRVRLARIATLMPYSVGWTNTSAAATNAVAAP